MQQFWEQYEYLNYRNENGARIEQLNHTPGKGTVAINFSHFQQIANGANLDRLPWIQLKPLLKVGKKRPFIKTGTVRSPRLGETVHCWIFKDIERKQETEAE